MLTIRFKKYSLQNHWATGIEIGIDRDVLWKEAKINKKLPYIYAFYIEIKLIGVSYGIWIGKKD